MSGGSRYVDADDQAFLTGATFNHLARYFGGFGGDAPLIEYLPLDDPPASPTVRIANAGGAQGVAFWVDGYRNWSVPVNTRLTGLTLQGNNGQPPLFIGDNMEVKLNNLTIRYGMNAVASLPTSSATRYPMSIVDCSLNALDASISLRNTIYSTERTTIDGNAGITAVREYGSSSVHKTFFLGAATDTIFEIHGGQARIQDVIVDDENGGPSKAYVQMYQGWGQPSRLIVDGLDVSLGSVPFVDLIGLGLPASGWATTVIDVRNLSAFGGGVGQPGVILRSSGPLTAFSGIFNMTGVEWGTIQGPTNINVVGHPIPVAKP